MVNVRKHGYGSVEYPIISLHQRTSTSMAITFVYFADCGSHSLSGNQRCDGESWRSQQEILGKWQHEAASLRCPATQLGFRCWAMVCGFLELEIERTVLRKKGASSVAAPTCCGTCSTHIKQEHRIFSAFLKLVFLSTPTGLLAICGDDFIRSTWKLAVYTYSKHLNVRFRVIIRTIIHISNL